MNIKDIENKYKQDQKSKKDKIKAEPKKFKRFWKWLWYLISFPFIWIWINLRDWRTLLIFMIVFLVLSSEIWVPYLIGWITWGTDLSKWMLGVGSACWVFWLGPGTPFLPLCIFVTIGVKAIFNKIRKR